VDFGWEAAVGLAALGLAVGAFGTLVGAGGGFVLTPILLLLYPHDSPKTITAISLATVFCNAASGSAAYARQRRIDLRSGIVFGAATLPGSVAGALAVEHVGRRVFDAATAAVLVLGATWLLALRKTGTEHEREGSPRRLTDALGTVYAYNVPLARGAALSVGVGFISTFLGIGGGILHVPLLVGALGFPTHIATATSHFVLAIMSGSATVTHLLSGNLAVGHGLRRAGALSVGVVVGAQVGAHVSTRITGRAIELLLAAAMIGLAVRLVIALA
jgi:uncharacterized protein